MTVWLTIDTAPKDGSTIDLWCRRSWKAPAPYVRSPSMYWCSKHLGWRERGRPYDGWWMPHATDKHLIPTHWMPVPDPPAGHANPIKDA